MLNRRRDIRRAESPDSVNTQTYFAPDEVGDLRGGEGDRATQRARLRAERRDALEPVILGRGDDARHRLHGDDRVLADARLAAQHHGIRTVEHGVRHV